MIHGTGAALARAPARRFAVRLFFDLFKLRIGLVIGFTAVAGPRGHAGPGAARLAGPGARARGDAGLRGGRRVQPVRRARSRCAHGPHAPPRVRHRPPRSRARRGWPRSSPSAPPASRSPPSRSTFRRRVYTFLGAFTYGVVYTVWLKRRTWWNIVIGGLAGSFAVLAGAAAVAPGHARAVAARLRRRAVPVDATAFLEPRDRLPRGLRGGAGADAAGRRRRRARRARRVRAAPSLLVAASLVPSLFGMGWLYLAAALGGGGVLPRDQRAARARAEPAHGDGQFPRVADPADAAARRGDRRRRDPCVIRATGIDPNTLLLAAAIGLVSGLVAGAAVRAGAARGHARSMRAAALELSQRAVGKPARRLHAERDGDGTPVRLADYRGKPLLVSFVYTGCLQVCPATTQFLGRAVEEAQRALGRDAFNVVTVGFNLPFDTPVAMREFQKRQGIDLPNWDISRRRCADDRRTRARRRLRLGADRRGLRPPHAGDDRRWPAAACSGRCTANRSSCRCSSRR